MVRIWWLQLFLFDGVQLMASGILIRLEQALVRFPCRILRLPLGPRPSRCFLFSLGLGQDNLNTAHLNEKTERFDILPRLERFRFDFRIIKLGGVYTSVTF